MKQKIHFVATACKVFVDLFPWCKLAMESQMFFKWVSHCAKITFESTAIVGCYVDICMCVYVHLPHLKHPLGADAYLVTYQSRHLMFCW